MINKTSIITLLIFLTVVLGCNSSTTQQSVTAMPSSPTILASETISPTQDFVETAVTATIPPIVVTSTISPTATTPEQETIQKSPETEFINSLTQDTWAYLSSDWATDNHLPWSWRSATLVGGDFVNPAEIGFYALSWLGAYDLGQMWSPSWSDTEAEITAVLDQLRAWQTEQNSPNAYNNSVFYQWYWINPTPIVGAGDVDHVVPSVDNAWLAASLITIREYSEVHGHTALEQKADDILADMEFSIWYDTNSHRFYWGDTENPTGGGLADYYSNENRIINFVAYALGDISREEFLLSLDALVQNSGEYNGITVDKVNWDGSYFTYASPALFIQEMGTYYGSQTILPATQAQIAYAQDQGYSAWGLSDCFDIGAGDYIQQGAPPADSPDPLETHPGVVSPHASVMALITPLASDSITNLQTISNTFPLAYEMPYGFRDSIMVNPTDPDYGTPSERFSALNQEWIFLSLLNYQTEFIWDYFYHDEGVRRAHYDMYPPTAYLPIITNPNS